MLDRFERTLKSAGRLCAYFVSHSALNYTDFYIELVVNDDGLSVLQHSLVAVGSSILST